MSRPITSIKGRFKYLSHDWDSTIKMRDGFVFRSVNEGMRMMEQLPTHYEQSVYANTTYDERLYSIVYAKFRSNEQLQEELVSTWPREIIYPGEDDNISGQILMQIRAYYRFIQTMLDPVEI